MSDVATRDRLIFGLNEDLITVERSLRQQTNEIQSLLKNISENSGELLDGRGDIPPDMGRTAIQHLSNVNSLSNTFLTLQELKKRLDELTKSQEENEKITAHTEQQLQTTATTVDKIDRFATNIEKSALFKGAVFLNDSIEYLLRKVRVVTRYLSQRALDHRLAKTKPFDILVVGGDFTSLTGVHRPITNYLNYCKEQGFSVHRIDLSKTDINRHKAKMIAKRAKTLIFNGSGSFLHESTGRLADAMQADGKTSYFYVHETQWGFDTIKARWPDCYERLKKYLPKVHVLCSTYAQRGFLRKRFNMQTSSVVYNNTQPLLDGRPENIAVEALEATAPLNILMVGTIQKRKGVDLFSELADEARERQLPWSFAWVGRGNAEGLYQSENVDWVGALRGEPLVEKFLAADVIFIASVDDPLPLVCLEAIQIFRRLVVYRGIGTSEILDNIPGTAIYEDYSVDAAIGAIGKAAQSPIDMDEFERLAKNYGDIPTFSERLNKVIGLKTPQVNFVSHPFYAGAAQNYIDSGPFADALDRPLVVVANGPSCGDFDPRRIPENPVVFRCNLFMFEEGYPFGTHADGMFWSIHRRILQEALATTLDMKLYSVDNYFTPMSLRNTALPAFRDMAEKHEDKFQPHFSHLNLVRLNPRLAKYFMPRNKRASTELPTQGLQMVAAGCALGFKKIYVVGLDFYEKTGSRYSFEWPDYVTSLAAPKHRGGFEQNAHSRDMETGFLAALSEEFPDVEIFAVSEDSYLSKLKPLAPKLEKHWQPTGPEKDTAKFHETLRRTLQDIDGVFMGAQIRGGILHGWAWKPSEPGQHLKVDIFRGNQCVTTLEANAYDDALDQNSVGNAHHAFTVPVNKLKGSGNIAIACGHDARITIEPTNGATATRPPQPKPSTAATPPRGA